MINGHHTTLKTEKHNIGSTRQMGTTAIEKTSCLITQLNSWQACTDMHWQDVFTLTAMNMHWLQVFKNLFLCLCFNSFYVYLNCFTVRTNLFSKVIHIWFLQYVVMLCLLYWLLLMITGMITNLHTCLNCHLPSRIYIPLVNDNIQFTEKLRSSIQKIHEYIFFCVDDVQFLKTDSRRIKLHICRSQYVIDILVVDSGFY